MPIPVVKVKNLTDKVVHLRSADNDTLPLMPGASAYVKLKFVDWQTPSPKTVYIDQASLAAAKELKQKLAIGNISANPVPTPSASAEAIPATAS